MNSPSLFKNVKHDIPASIIVFFVALPLCLGIALASGAPLFSGIIAGIVGGIVVGAISGSSLGVSGPAAGLTVIVLSAIQTLNSFETFLLAIVIAGIFQIILGLVKAGVVGYYFPSSVIKGMLTAIGIIIILKQIPHAFGYDRDYEGDLDFFQADGENTFSELVTMLDFITPGALIISAFSMAILIIWEVYLSKKHKVFSILQGPLVAVAAGIGYQLLAEKFFPGLSLQPEHLVNVPVADSATSFIHQFSLPDFSQLGNKEVYVIAFTIAIVASLETLLCVEATDKLDPAKNVTPTNRELIAQGAGNIVSGLIGGLPVTQVIVRSSANIQSGGKSKLSAILHGILLLLCVLIIPKIINMIPLAVLASILLVVGYKLAKPSLFKQIYRLGWTQFVPFMVTILGIVFTDLLTGIMCGLVIGFFIIIRNSYRNSHFLHIEEDEGHTKIKMTLAEEVTFLNKGAILKELKNIPAGASVIIDISESHSVDYDVIEIIENFMVSARSNNISVKIITGEEAVTPES